MFQYIKETSISLPANILEEIHTHRQPEVADQVWRDRPGIPLIRSIVDSFKDEYLTFPKIFRSEGQECVLDKDAYYHFKSEYNKYLLKFGSPGCYRSIKLNNQLEKKILDCLPSEIIDYVTHVSLQATFYNGLWPHTDHNRKSSLFFMLTSSDNFETAWYKGNFNPIFQNQAHYLKTMPMYDTLIEDKKLRLDKEKFYVFDNFSYHSSNSIIQQEPRRTLVIEFKDLYAEELYNLIPGHLR